MNERINIIPAEDKKNTPIPFALRFAEKANRQGSLMATQYTTVVHTGPAPGHEDPMPDED